MNIQLPKETTILVTGSAGFIGFHVAKKLLEMGIDVIGIDNFNNYYDVSLKESRNKILKEFDNYKFYKGDLKDLNFVKKVLDEIPEVTFNGHSEYRLSNNAHFTFLGVNGEDLIIKLDEYGVAASTGSACSVNTQKASHVLESMGFSLEQITGSLRLTVGIFNTENEINKTVDILKKVVEELRAVSPFKEKYSFGSKN